jgi:hypothetical protein
VLLRNVIVDNIKINELYFALLVRKQNKVLLKSFQKSAQIVDSQTY